MPDKNKPLATEKFRVEADAVEFFYPNVTELTTPNYGERMGKPCYSVNAGFGPDHPDLKVLKSLLAGLRKKALNGHPDVLLPLKDGTKKADAIKESRRLKGKEPSKVDEAMRGKFILFASSEKFPPGLSYLEAGNLVDVSDEMRQSCRKFFSGGLGGVEVTLAAWGPSPMAPHGCIKAYLNSLCAFPGGTRLSGDSSARWEGLRRNVGTVSDEDPTGDEDKIEL